MAFTPHPEPPADLARRDLPLVEVEGMLYRTHRKDLHPLWFGRSATWRWDSPTGSFGVLYSATDAAGAFLETFGHTTGVKLIVEADAEARALARLVPARPLRVVDLRAEGLVALGADARLWSGDYAVSQRWAEALHAHPVGADGVLYPSRHQPRLGCVAVFDRARPALAVDGSDPWLGPRLRRQFGRFCDRYGFALV